MKSLLRLSLAAAGAVASIGLSLAHAEDGVSVGGTAEPMCVLPDAWTFVSAGGGAAGAQFSGKTWTIPESAIADSNATAPGGAEYAIRIRGQGSCNASHTITLSSARGGLIAGDPAAAAPSGFSRRLPVKYDAYWSGVNFGDGGTYGNSASYTPTTPGQTKTVTNTVTSTKPPPGLRYFDIRLGVARSGVSGLMMAGDYSDTLTVTIALAG